MKTKDALKAMLTSTQGLFNSYLADLSDQDILVRPVPNANNIAWQIGHLIGGEVWFGKQFPGGKFPTLTPAQVEAFGMKKSDVAPPGGWLKKAEYLDLFNKARAATIAAVDGMSDADFDRPTEGDMAKWAPTLGDLVILTANHTLMHAGQFTVVRRALNKPVLF